MKFIYEDYVITIISNKLLVFNSEKKSDRKFWQREFEIKSGKIDWEAKSYIRSDWKDDDLRNYCDRLIKNRVFW